MDVMLDALSDDLVMLRRAQFMLNKMKDYNPDLSQAESIVGMLVYAKSDIPTEVIPKFSSASQALAVEWVSFQLSAREGVGCALTAPLTRILKTLCCIEMEAALNNMHPLRPDETAAAFFKLGELQHKVDFMSSYYGAANCVLLDIAYDENIIQIQHMKDRFLADIEEMDNHIPPMPGFPPQP